VADSAAHVDRYGPLPVLGAELIGMVRAAGLLGRGGAWFPTGAKLAAVAAGRRTPVVVANGAEGEPASDKDKALLTVAPHLVVDGMVLAAVAIGADEAILCVHRGSAVRAAIAQRHGDPVAIRLVEMPARFVASEESALVNFLNTGEARPTETPPRPYERGVRGRPTLVDNVETLANVALIGRYGADWFRTAGTPEAPGTMLVTVGGVAVRPGVREIPLGTTLSAALGYQRQVVHSPAVMAGAPPQDRIDWNSGGPREPADERSNSGGGNGAADSVGAVFGHGVTEPVSAVLVGGFGGNWLPLPAAADLPLTPGALAAAGGALGVGMLLALPARACGLAETARILRYLAGESAMQCGPCMFGLAAIVDDVEGLTYGRPTVERLRYRLGMVGGRGACAHPDGAVRLAASALTVFADDVRAHASGRPCAGARMAPVIRVPASGMGLGWR
jgi:NADH:ubiquinone oxidoreductase subunit F (NADH-binding)